jgi:N-acetylmuramoyl-L-alanine amidase
MSCRCHIVRGLHFQPVVILLLSAGLILLHYSPVMGAFSRAERKVFQRSIIDKRKQLHPKFEKVPRKTTKYIIVHTSEAGLNATLKIVSKGKSVRGRRLTYGGHAHYVIARDGRKFRILDKKYEADHAGLSMWNGETDVSKVSIGIELVGYHYTEITRKQYRSVGILIDILQGTYSLDDNAVLTHSQVAYGNPNFWFKKEHRGRKRCAMNFDRARAGLGPTWSFDPDVKAGRLVADPELASIFYGRRLHIATGVDANVITAKNTAWTIAGEDYDSPTTLYQFPNGRVIPGDKIKTRVGWNRIPKSTVVLLNQETSPYDIGNRGPVKTISNGLTAWTFAGPKYKNKTTFYIFPKGQIKNGSQISDWDELPSQTKMIVGYHGPHKVTRCRPPIKIAGTNYKGRETLYYFPERRLLPGNKVKDFRRLPAGVLMFVPEKRS